MIILPNEWVSWTRKLSLKPEGRYVKGEPLLYMVGHGRHWRVASSGYFQFSELDATFDRWANSLLAQIELPTKYEDLYNFVEYSKTFSI